MTPIEILHAEMASCRRCLEAGFDIGPGAVFSGSESAEVMVIGQAPGITEMSAKRPFNAGSGRRLFEWLGQAGWDEEDFRKRHYMTSVTKCYPGKSQNGKGDRVPSAVEQGYCRPFLERELSLVKPRLIIPVGGLAIKLFYPSHAKLSTIIGTVARVPSRLLWNLLREKLDKALITWAFVHNALGESHWLVPLPHPSGASLWPNNSKNKALISRAIEILAHIRLAYDL